MASTPASPSQRSQFTKPWLSCADQAVLLAQRGLVISDLPEAVRFLEHINYYRFSGYCLAFEQSRHVFIAGTTFEQVRGAYEFDCALRDLITEAVEVIEVDFRTAIAYHFGRRYGAFGHVHCGNFYHGFVHSDWLQKVHQESTRSSEVFVEHYRRTYDGFPNLPVWMVTEVVSFGSLSKMFGGMLAIDQKAIAARYQIQAVVLKNWAHHLAYVRNLCAHHARLWDKEWAIRPMLPYGNAWNPPLLPNNERLFATLLILHHLLKRCAAVQDFAARWRGRLTQHLETAPSCPGSATRMGLTAAWTTHPKWQ